MFALPGRLLKKIIFFKKMLTNNELYCIIVLSNEREIKEMTDVYILLKNFDEEGWETYSVTTTFEKACEDAKDHASHYGNGKCTKYCVEHWQLENSAYFCTVELDLEKI